MLYETPDFPLSYLFCLLSICIAIHSSLRLLSFSSICSAPVCFTSAAVRQRIHRRGRRGGRIGAQRSEGVRESKGHRACGERGSSFPWFHVPLFKFRPQLFSLITGHVQNDLWCAGEANALFHTGSRSTLSRWTLGLCCYHFNLGYSLFVGGYSAGRWDSGLAFLRQIICRYSSCCGCRHYDCFHCGRFVGCVCNTSKFPVDASISDAQVEFGSLKYYALCALGGVISCGVTHTAIVPLDLVKCRIQVVLDFVAFLYSMILNGLIIWSLTNLSL